MTTPRNPDVTRTRIVKAAFQEMYLRGFQGMRVDEVLERTGLKKGALYHHFPSKLALGYAVLDEVISDMILGLWVRPLEGRDDPVEAMAQLLDTVSSRITSEQVSLGCPLNNLAQEMSPVDEGFRNRVKRVFAAWEAGLTRCFETGQRTGLVRRDIDLAASATFIVGAIEGCSGIAKTNKSAADFRNCADQLKLYLEGLRRPVDQVPYSPARMENAFSRVG